MDSKGRYGPAERAAYQPPPCPDCGETTRIRVSWVDATDLSDPPGADFTIQGSMLCLTCRGRQGD